jgi:cytochrome b subunit of formate dehydrogenase
MIRSGSIFFLLVFSVILFPVVAVAQESCLVCHSDPDLETEREGQTVSLFVSEEEFLVSVHGDSDCDDCHTGFDPDELPHAEETAPVDCGGCHDSALEAYTIGVHGAARGEGKQNAPACADCHGKHNILPGKNPDSPTFRMNVPALCGECHQEKGKAVTSGAGMKLATYFDYSSSVHGKGLTEKGLLPTAICTDCHGSHEVLENENMDSPVNRKNVSQTCGKCHRGMLVKYMKGIHFSDDPEKMKSLPTCAECHSAHQITEVDESRFMKEITHQCGSCHGELSKTYLETMHGKAYQLDYLKAARCSDCHEPHYALHVVNPDSTVGENRIVETCRKCHAGANVKFTQYLTHADYKDRENYPVLYLTYTAMTALLVGVFGFFGIHTLLWLPRSYMHAKETMKESALERKGRYIVRFTLSERVTHILVIVSFLLLAFTGMLLKFSSMEWTLFASKLIGGAGVARVIHRLCAVVTFGYFIYHFLYLRSVKLLSRVGWKDFLYGENSLVPNMQDLRDFYGTIKWFVGLGERPKYGRWTYWEKFDYFAVFWGVPVIGISGLMLWFPEFFTGLLPGWIINVAVIIHSDEALLAVGFIFTIHFFNTHLRPESFPMDKVIFTGLVSEEKYKEDRPRDYEALVKSGELERRIVDVEEPGKWDRYIYFFGSFSLSLGIVLVIMIIYSMLFG